jgi:uncharacterized protein Smg (DUF494 family)
MLIYHKTRKENLNQEWNGTIVFFKKEQCYNK